MSQEIEIKTGWWRQRDGNVALVTAVSKRPNEAWPATGVENINIDGGRPESWTIFGHYLGSNQEKINDLIEYLGPFEVPTFED